MKRIICRIIGHNIREIPGDWTRCTRCKRRYFEIAGERMGRRLSRLVTFARSRSE